VSCEPGDEVCYLRLPVIFGNVVSETLHDKKVLVYADNTSSRQRSARVAGGCDVLKRPPNSINAVATRHTV